MSDFNSTFNKAGKGGRIFLLTGWSVAFLIKFAFYIGLTYWAVLGLGNIWSWITG